MRVMLVEDSSGDARLIEDNPGDVRLTREAFIDGKVWNNLHNVPDGVEALAFLDRRGEYAGAPRPDLILLDLNMPYIDGEELLIMKESDILGVLEGAAVKKKKAA